MTVGPSSHRPAVPSFGKFAPWQQPTATAPYVVPFAVFMVLLGLQDYLGALLGRSEYLLRVLVLCATLFVFSRSVISFSIRSWFGSVVLGLAVFAVWVGPDVLWPGYRQSIFFQNALLGTVKSGVAAADRTDYWVLGLRLFRAAVLVPIIEELFWRAWLMRWLINPAFARVPLGAYAARAFWITALLFASEHGSFWEVGLIAGVAYNWWMVRTRSLGDCILAHAVTNAVLSVYVLRTGQWQYWS